MPTVVLESYMLILTLPFALVLGTMLANAGHRAGLGPETTLRAILLFGIILGVWFALATYLGKAGRMGQAAFPNGPPLIGLFFLLGGLFVWTTARATPLARTLTNAMGQDVFMGLQTFRILGGIFLIGWAFGDIPWLFAIPAGFGDILAGIVGYRAMRAVQRQDPNARGKIILANVVGMGDFLIALSTGLLTSDTIYQIMAFDAPNIVGEFPLVLIPGFFVPIFLGAHFLSVQRLLRDRTPLAGKTA